MRAHVPATLGCAHRRRARCAAELQFLCGGERIEGDPIAGHETGENLDALAEALSEPHLTHRGAAARIHDVNRRDFATLDGRLGGHQQPLGLAGHEAHLDEHPRIEVGGVLGQLEPGTKGAGW